MLISSNSTAILESRLISEKKTFCSGLFLSARWFVFSQAAKKGLHLIVLPNQESAEYCCSDLYSLIDGDRVFFLPSSGNNVARSNYKSSLCVQRTASIGKIMEGGKDLTVIVSYPDALNEKIPVESDIKSSILKIKKGDIISYEKINEELQSKGFEKVDFVSAPGQYAIRGSIYDIFSYSYNYPYRISLWGDEVEKINVFDCNTQLSKSEEDEIEIISDISSNQNGNTDFITRLLPKDTVIWLDSSDMYSKNDFFETIEGFRTV